MLVCVQCRVLPLMLLWPDADVPVIELSILSSMSPGGGTQGKVDKLQQHSLAPTTWHVPPCWPPPGSHTQSARLLASTCGQPGVCQP